jgi:hypothetical protein
MFGYITLFTAIGLAAALVILRRRGSASQAATSDLNIMTLPPTALIGPVIPRKRWLVGIGGEVSGRNYWIGERTITIGRTPNSTIQIVDTAASRTHCQLRPIGEDDLQIVDMHSRNATFINNQPCTVGKMSPGDELRIGQARFRYLLHVEADKDDSLSSKMAGHAAVLSTRGPSQSTNLVALIGKALADTQGDADRAAAKLGITTATLHRVLEESTKRPS